MYGFTEIRTEDERYVISCLIDFETNKPDPKWVSFIMQEEIKGEMEEMEAWDNNGYLNKTFIPLLKKVYDDDMTLKQFHKENDRAIKDLSAKELFPTKEDVEQVYELFLQAKKLKMI